MLDKAHGRHVASFTLKNQIPPDLVVKFQPIDIIDVIL
jgi:hypothetical protein